MSRVSLRGLVAIAAVLIAGVLIAVAANPPPQVDPDPSRSDRSDREAQAVKLLASQGATFTPATAADRAKVGLARPPKPAATFDGVPPRALGDAKVYLGRLREINGPNLGPHGGWAVLERGFSTPHQSKPRNRLAYLAEIRDVPACSVEISCLSVGTGPGPKPFEAYYSYIDAKTGRALGALGVPEGYSREHGLNGASESPLAGFSDGQLHFRYPASWQKLNPRASSTFSIPLVDLSTEKLHAPCSHPKPAHVSCGSPLDLLPGDGVLVTWAATGYPSHGLEQTAGEATKVDGHPAKLSSSTRACRYLGAAAARTLTIQRSLPHNFFEMRACIGGDDGGAGARAVDRMIDSIRISG
jgi:hypothetical protein